MEDTPEFTSVEEELQYWKNLALEYKKGMEEARDELDEFQTHSRMLEQELERELDMTERKRAELDALSKKLKIDVESLRDKLDQSNREHDCQLVELESEVNEYRSIKEDLYKYIRELEQTNDDLERAKRATVVSIEDFEGRLNQAIERNAFLESELEQKEALKFTVQRLKDEARDMRQELQIRNKENLTLDRKNSLKHTLSSADSNKITTEMETQTAPGSPSRKTPLPLTPSARISALNIVGDLLRKVGALESKLASCRNLVKDSTPALTNKELRRNSGRQRNSSTPSSTPLIKT